MDHLFETMGDIMEEGTDEESGSESGTKESGSESDTKESGSESGTKDSDSGSSDDEGGSFASLKRKKRQKLNAEVQRTVDISVLEHTQECYEFGRDDMSHVLQDDVTVLAEPLDSMEIDQHKQNENARAQHARVFPVTLKVNSGQQMRMAEDTNAKLDEILQHIKNNPNNA